MLSPRTLSWSTCHSSTGTNQRAHPRGHPWWDAAAVSDIVGNLGGSKRLPWHMAHMATDVYVLYVDVVVVWWLLRLHKRREREKERKRERGGENGWM